MPSALGGATEAGTLAKPRKGAVIGCLSERVCGAADGGTWSCTCGHHLGRDRPSVGKSAGIAILAAGTMNAGHARRERREDWARRLREREFESQTGPISPDSFSLKVADALERMDDDAPIAFHVTPLGRMTNLVASLHKLPDDAYRDLALGVCRTVITYCWGPDVASELFD